MLYFHILKSELVLHTEKRYVENDIKSDCICSDEKSLLKSTFFMLFLIGDSLKIM